VRGSFLLLRDREPTAPFSPQMFDGKLPLKEGATVINSAVANSRLRLRNRQMKQRETPANPRPALPLVHNALLRFALCYARAAAGGGWGAKKIINPREPLRLYCWFASEFIALTRLALSCNGGTRGGGLDDPKEGTK
jgi:hypothetical protein